MLTFPFIQPLISSASLQVPNEYSRGGGDEGDASSSFFFQSRPDIENSPRVSLFLIVIFEKSGRGGGDIWGWPRSLSRPDRAQILNANVCVARVINRPSLFPPFYMIKPVVTRFVAHRLFADDF